jgi:sterol desaturase/sphingolipid hydroxylase (fatty acid hydroxylase superfamily)
MSSPIAVLEALGSVLAGVAFFAFLPLELWQRHRRGQLTKDALKEMAASCSPFLPTLLTSGLLVAYFALLFGAASRLAPWHIPTTPWTIAAALLAVDFVYYWDHRASHRVRLLWATAHSVHHSSPLYDQTVGLRITFLDGYLSLWFYVPLALLGFEPLLIAAAFGVILGYQQWLHT